METRQVSSSSTWKQLSCSLKSSKNCVTMTRHLLRKVRRKLARTGFYRQYQRQQVPINAQLANQWLKCTRISARLWNRRRKSSTISESTRRPKRQNMRELSCTCIRLRERSHLGRKMSFRTKRRKEITWILGSQRHRVTSTIFSKWWSRRSSTRSAKNYWIWRSESDTLTRRERVAVLCCWAALHWIKIRLTHR